MKKKFTKPTSSIYKSLSEWKKVDPEAFIAANNRGMLEEICEVFGWRKPRKIENSNGLITIKLTEEEFDIIAMSLNHQKFHNLEELSEEELNAIYKLGGKVSGAMIRAEIDTIQTDLLGKNLDDVYNILNE